jgi:hypothetical protein
MGEKRKTCRVLVTTKDTSMKTQIYEKKILKWILQKVDRRI